MRPARNKKGGPDWPDRPSVESLSSVPRRGTSSRTARSSLGAQPTDEKKTASGDVVVDARTADTAASPLGVIEDVEGFGSKLEASGFVDLKAYPGNSRWALPAWPNIDAAWTGERGESGIRAGPEIDGYTIGQ